MIAERVQVEEPRSREQERQHVGQSHGHEHRVGRCPHVTFGQDQDDQRVGHDGDDQQEGHDVAVKRKGVADVQVGRNVHRPAEVVELYVQQGDVDLLLQVGLHGDGFIGHGLHLHLSVFRRWSSGGNWQDAATSSLLSLPDLRKWKRKWIQFK